MEKALRETMMHMTYGIYVLTTRFEKTINGMIASPGNGRIDFTVGSALDIFGGSGLRYRDLVRHYRK